MLDASLSVPVVENLLDRRKATEFVGKEHRGAGRTTASRSPSGSKKRWCRTREALARRFKTDWATVRIDRPAFLGRA